MRRIVMVLLLLSAVLIAVPAIGQELIVYPNKNQSDEQMEADKFNCYKWAKKETGFDPMVKPTASAPPPQKEAGKSSAVRGGARGALVGLAVGSMSGEAGKGAAIGATAGGLMGGMRKRDRVSKDEKAEQEWAQQQAAEYNQMRAGYNRAYGACLEGQGYTVK